MIRETLQEGAQRGLTSEGSARKFLVLGGPGAEGWTFAVSLGQRWISGRSREPIRACASLTMVGTYAERIGARGFGVEL